MSTVTFTGPIKAGDVLNTTGTTAGSVKNVGFVEMSQQVAIAQSATAAATTICIPANSTIVAIDLFVTTAWSSATTTYTISVGTSDDIIYVLSGAPGATPGAGTLVVRYIQATNA